MLYKEDWEKVRERMCAFWRGEIVDRVVFQVTGARENVPQTSRWHPFFLAQHYDEPELILSEWESYCRQTFFGGEFIPNLWVNLGPGVPAAFLGALLRVNDDTVWFEAPGDISLEELAACRLDLENKWWRVTRDITRLAAENAPGKYFAGMTDLNSVFDIICHLRGTQRVLYDMMDNPDAVKAATEAVNRVWIESFERLNALITPHQDGASNWMSIWFEGCGGDTQCDFSAMLSPDMFAEFVVPHLQQECVRLGHSIFHLDGPGQIPHLDLLLDIPELDGIQWVPGAGNPSVGSPKWYPMYRKIQEKGKLLVLQNMERQDVENTLASISSRGLLVEVKADSDSEARDWLKKAEKWTRD